MSLQHNLLKKNIGQNLTSFFRLIYYKFKNLNSVRLNKISPHKKNKMLAVLGNGPSLQTDINKILNDIDDYEVICVNNFANSQKFKEFKPKYYIFLDSYFFQKTNVHNDWLEIRERTFKSLNKNTSWEMTLLIPPQANIEFFNEKISNKNINIVQFSTVGLNLQSQTLSNFFFDSGFFGPFQGNVLIYAIYFGVTAGYKEVHIYGADTNFHNNVSVNQQNNDTEIIFQHFNEKDKLEKFLKNPEKQTMFTMTEFFKLTYDTFNAHQQIKNYSVVKNVKILNKSHYSLLDCYERN